MQEVLANTLQNWEDRRRRIEDMCVTLQRHKKELSQEISIQQRKLDTLKKRNFTKSAELQKFEDMKQKLQRIAKFLDERSGQVENLHKKVSKEKRVIDATSTEVQQKEQYLTQLQTDLKTLEQELDGRESKLRLDADAWNAKLLMYKRKEEELRGQESAIKSQQSSLEARKDEIERKESHLAEQVHRFDEQQSSLVAEKDAVEQKKAQLTTFHHQLQRQKADLEQRERDLTLQKTTLAQEQKENQSATQKVKPILENTLYYQKKLYELENRVKILARDAHHLEQRRSDAVQALERIQKSTDDCRAQSEDALLKKHNAELDIRRLKNESEQVINHTKALEKQLEERQKRLQLFEKNILQKDLKLKDELEKAQVARFKADQEHIKAKASADMLAGKEKVLQDQEKQLHKWETQLKNEQVRHAKMRGQLEAFEQKLRDVEVRELESARKEANLKALEEYLAQRKKDVEALQESKDYASLRSENEKLNNSEYELKMQNKDLDHTIQELKAKLAALESDKQEISEAYKKVATQEVDLKARDDRIVQLEEQHKRLIELTSRHDDSNEDVRQAFVALDKLMEELPDDVLQDFVKSEGFKHVEKVFDQFHIGK